MNSSSGLGNKYAVGKMAEIMIACSDIIFKLKEETYDASREVMSIGETPVVCTSNCNYSGNYANTKQKKSFINRNMSLIISPTPEDVQDPRIRRIYQKILDLENIGREEWLKVFMYVSSYMRVLRPLSRAKFDCPKKLVQHQTLVLDGPYSGLQNDLIIPEKKSPGFKKFQKSSKDSVFEYPTISVKNIELENVEDTNEVFLSQRFSSRFFNCDCLGVADYSPGTIQTRSIKKKRRKYFLKKNYCFE